MAMGEVSGRAASRTRSITAGGMEEGRGGVNRERERRRGKRKRWRTERREREGGERGGRI